MEDNIINRLEQKIDAKIIEMTEKTLQGHHERINKNSDDIRELSNSIEPLSDNGVKIMEEMEDLKCQIKDNEIKSDKNASDTKLLDEKIQSIEEVLDHKAYKMPSADRRRLKSLEREVDYLKASLNKKST